MQRVRMERSIGVLILCVFVVLGMLLPQGSAYAEGAGESVKYYDGVYEGTGTGHRGEIKVSVKIEGGKITEVSEVSQGETQSYWNQAKALFDTIVQKQSADVDGITGATNSSNGIKQAVSAALAEAAKEPASPDGPFSSGTGTEADPYMVSTASGLAKFASTVDEGESYEGKFIALSGDIALDSESSWNPAGTESKYDASSSKVFSGTFDGKGHSITGLAISGSYAEETNIGLFSILNKGAEVRNLKVEGIKIDVTGSDVIRAGGIAGDTVSGSDGSTGAWVDRCRTEGTIKVDTSGQKLAFGGGIFGRGSAWSKVSNSYADVDVTAFSRGGNNSAYAGGIAGNTGNNALQVNCASFGDLYGCSPKSTNYGGMAGGITAMLAGKTWNAYATGNARVGNGGAQQQVVGALTGQATTSGMAGSGTNRTYPETGALRDFLYYPKDVSLAIEKWNTQGSEVAETQNIEPRAAGIVTVAYDTIFETKAIATERADMAKEEFCQTLNGNLKDVTKLLDAYGYAGVSLNNWTLVDGKVVPEGDKWVDTEPDASIFEAGTGTSEDPYMVKTETQLRAFAGSLNEGVDYDGYFVQLAEDIDVGSAEWKPIGGVEYAFNGTFDGAGYTVRGMKAGTEESPYVMGRENPYMGFFGVLGKDAVVRNLNLADVEIYAKTPRYAYVGGIAGINDSYSETRKGLLVDGVSVTGKIVVTADEGNTFCGGILAYQSRGSVINSWTDMDLSCTVKKGNAVAEVGGLVGLNNRGLVVNSYTLGDVFGSASRNDGDEGMASTGNLVGVQAGDLVGCYSKGDNRTGEFSVYAGELAGWITGVGKMYSCFYNKEAVMDIGGSIVNPPAEFGTKVAPGVNEEGDAYIGGLVDDLNSYTAADYGELAGKLNAKYSAYPVDLSVYGISGSSLKKWKFDEEKNLVTFASEHAEVTYKQPEVEIVPPVVEVLRDGKWYGRDAQKTAIVAITVESGEITETEVLKGEAGTDAYEEALATARSKSVYGDRTGYGEAKASLFAGGTGTKEDPYLISNGEQLRALASAINSDEAFEGKYFRQTADIDVGGAEWLPIGHGIFARINEAWRQYAAYPFLGHYDGAGFEIKNLTIGSKEKPSDDPTVNYTAGLFGFVAGEHGTNDEIKDGERISQIKGIKLRNASVHVKSTGQNYVAGIVGNAQNGFIIDGCSVTGEISSYSKDSFARAGGIASNALRGSVINCWSDVRIDAETDAGNVYAGGLLAMDNRTATVNCYARGDLAAGASGNNKIHIGGLVGQLGGVMYNSYAFGNIESRKTTTDAGLVSGRVAGISILNKVYYNSSAKITISGTEREAAAVGVAVPEGDSVVTIGKTSQEMGQNAFVQELNANRAASKAAMTDIRGKIENISMPYAVHFSGESDELAEWKLEEANAILASEDGNSGGGSQSGGTASGGGSQNTGGTGTAQGGSSGSGTSDAAKALAKRKAAYNKAVKAAKARKVKGFKVKARKGRKARLTWKKVKGASGYVVYRSTKKSGKYKKVKTVKKAGTLRFTNKKLKAGKKYYYKIRPFTNVKNVSGKSVRVYGKYSKAVKIKARR